MQSLLLGLQSAALIPLRDDRAGHGDCCGEFLFYRRGLSECWDHTGRDQCGDSRGADEKPKHNAELLEENWDRTKFHGFHKLARRIMQNPGS